VPADKENRDVVRGEGGRVYLVGRRVDTTRPNLLGRPPKKGKLFSEKGLAANT